MFKCTCGLSFPTLKVLQRHQRMFRGPDGNYPPEHFKVQTVTRSEAAVKAGVTRRHRRLTKYRSG